MVASPFSRLAHWLENVPSPQRGEGWGEGRHETPQWGRSAACIRHSRAIEAHSWRPLIPTFSPLGRRGLLDAAR
jgi:hypothetical protein